MALQVEVGTFSVATNQTSVTVNCGFQGKALIIFGTFSGNNSEGAAAGGITYGFTDGSNHFCIGSGSDNAVSTSNEGKSLRTTAFADMLSAGTPSSAQQLTGVTFNASTFVVTCGASLFGPKYNYILLGGSDITNVFVGNDTMPTSNGTKNVTNVGFQGDFVILLHNAMTAAGLSSAGAEMSFGVGMATSSSKRFAAAIGADDAQTCSSSVNGVGVSTNSGCIIGLGPGAQTIGYKADFTQFTSNGFDLNFSTAPASAYIFGYIVIKGGLWDCGSQAKPTTATTQTVTGMAFQPKLLGLILGGSTTSDSVLNAAISPGAAVSTTARATCGLWHNDAINTEVRQANYSNLCLREPKTSAGAGADFTSFNSDGWTITWAATGSAYLVGWFGATDAANVYDDSASFGATMGFTTDRAPILDTAAAMAAATMGFSGGTGLDAVGATSMAATAGYSPSSIADFLAASSLAATLGFSPSGVMSMSVGVSLAGTLALSTASTASTTYNESATFASVLGLSLATKLDAVGGSSFATNEGFSSASKLDAVGAASLPASLGFSPLGVTSMSVAASFAGTLAIATDGTVTSGPQTYNVSAAFAATAGYTTGSIWSVSAGVALALAAGYTTGATRSGSASTSFAATAGFSTMGGGLIAAAVSMAASLGYATTVAVGREGALSLASAMGFTPTKALDRVGSASFGATLGTTASTMAEFLALAGLGATAGVGIGVRLDAVAAASLGTTAAFLAACAGEWAASIVLNSTLGMAIALAGQLVMVERDVRILPVFLVTDLMNTLSVASSGISDTFVAVGKVDTDPDPGE